MIENNLEQDPFKEFEIPTKRRKLLPWWIKFFCWFFMFFGLLAFACLILGFTNLKPDLAFYGFETNEPFSLYGLIIISVALLKGFAGYALWFEKDFAVKIGKIDALIGIALCAISMLVLPFFKENFGITIRLELALLIPYLIRLHRIQKEWESQLI